MSIFSFKSSLIRSISKANGNIEQIFYAMFLPLVSFGNMQSDAAIGNHHEAGYHICGYKNNTLVIYDTLLTLIFFSHCLMVFLNLRFQSK